MAEITNRLRPFWWRSWSLVGLVVVWHVTAVVLNSSELPPPWAVLQTLGVQTSTGELPLHLSITLGRVAVAFAIAMAIGCAVGIWMGRSRRADLALDGLLILGLNIPALVTIILCYIWFGLTEVAAVTAVAINKIPTVAVLVREGARDVDRRLLQIATVYRLSRWRALVNVYLPQLYPYFLAAARSGLALIWKIVLVVELLGRSNGVGFQLGVYFQFFDITGILAYTIAFAVVVMAIEGMIMRPLDDRVSRGRA